MCSKHIKLKHYPTAPFRRRPEELLRYEVENNEGEGCIPHRGITQMCDTLS